MTDKTFDSRQQIQEAEYEYPYHYIPTSKDGEFSQVLYWPWGFRYLGCMQVILDRLKNMPFCSLIDIGCGDGRFLREVAKRYPRAELLGVDYSERAVQLAKALNPNLNYKVVNIVEESLPDRFDVATLVEVLEHIPHAQIDAFLKAIAGVLNDSGWLILTVPHVNNPILEKHYQHFTSNHLHKLLVSHFQDIAFVPFDPKSKVMAALYRLIGGEGSFFVLTHSQLLSWFFHLYKSRYLYANDEQKCGRIVAVCRKR
jgi:SAM-dependent methyltransferase